MKTKRKPKRRLIVRIREVHLSHRVVDTDDPEEALRIITDGESDGEEIRCEYHRTLHAETWDVTDEDGVVVRYPDAAIEQLV